MGLDLKINVLWIRTLDFPFGRKRDGRNLCTCKVTKNIVLYVISLERLK